MRLDVNLHAWGENVIEFLAIGTAVTHASKGEHWRAPNGKPFTSDLSGQDFWTLLGAGYRPLGFVMGNCVYHIAQQALDGWLTSAGKNMELPNYTQALYDARELAMERMQYEAQIDGAAGIVGTESTRRTTPGARTCSSSSPSAPRSAAPSARRPPTPQLVMTVNE